LTWTDNASNETQFEVQYDTADTFDVDPQTILVDTEDAESTEAATLDPDTTYYLRVRAKNGNGVSLWSDDVSATTEEAESPTPGVISNAGRTDTTINLVASDATGGTPPYAYQWFYDDIPIAEGAGTEVGDDDLTLAATGLDPSTTYYFRLRYTDDASQVVYSEQHTRSTTSGVVSASAAPLSIVFGFGFGF
jgi:phosphodiesterase/alkaline phosphatase D-like protein